MVKKRSALFGVAAGTLVLGALVAPVAHAAPVGAASSSPRCTIVGTPGDDELVGTPGRDVICGRGGDDKIRGLRGDDILRGGPGDDILIGGGGDDKIEGGSGDDRASGGAGSDEVTSADVLKDNPAWGVGVDRSYNLPTGTKVSWTYDLPSGNCIKYWQSWTDTIGERIDNPRQVFSTVHADPWESCAYERSYGDWTVKIVLPSGDTKTGSIHVSTGSPNIWVHHASTTCNMPAGVSCSDGSADRIATSDLLVTPPVSLTWGIPPKPPSLSCTRSVSYTVGQVLDEKNAHICTLEGFPRPELSVTDLPPGITASRWPTDTDSWIVLHGTVAKAWTGVIHVSGWIPQVWADSYNIPGTAK